VTLSGYGNTYNATNVIIESDTRISFTIPATLQMGDYGSRTLYDVIVTVGGVTLTLTAALEIVPFFADDLDFHEQNAGVVNTNGITGDGWTANILASTIISFSPVGGGGFYNQASRSRDSNTHITFTTEASMPAGEYRVRLNYNGFYYYMDVLYTLTEPRTVTLIRAVDGSIQTVNVLKSDDGSTTKPVTFLVND
jgi:hypothetical protein